MTLYVHIGTEKTGTTSVQKVLQINRRTLARQSIVFPSSLGDPNNAAAAVLMHEPGDERAFFAKWLNVQDSDTEDFAQVCYRKLEQEGALIGEHLVLSSEHMFSYGTEVAAIERLAEFLRQISEDIRIIAYLRPQDRLLPSLYSARIKAGSRDADLGMLKLAEQALWLDYNAVLSNFATVFGRASINARIYDANQLITDFLTQIDASPADLSVEVGRQNRALDSKQLDVLLRLNRKIPAQVDGRRNQMRRGLVDFIARTPMGAPLQLDEEIRDHLKDRFDASNEALSRNFLDGKDFSIARSVSERAVNTDHPNIDNEEALLLLLAELWSEHQSVVTNNSKSAGSRSATRRILGRLKRKLIST